MECNCAIIPFDGIGYVKINEFLSYNFCASFYSFRYFILICWLPKSRSRSESAIFTYYIIRWQISKSTKGVFRIYYFRIGITCAYDCNTEIHRHRKRHASGYRWVLQICLRVYINVGTSGFSIEQWHCINNLAAVKKSSKILVLLSLTPAWLHEL